MTVTDEELMAYVDGELDPARREALRQAVASSPDLSRRVAGQQALRERLDRAFNPVLDEPVPSRLVNLAARARADRLDMAVRRRWSRDAWRNGLALAASIALGIALGPALPQFVRKPSDIVASGTDLTAGGALADALSRQLASEQTGSDPVRLGISFRSTSGEYCRTFISRRGEDALAGMACRQDSAWRIDALQSVPVAAYNPHEYRQAATQWPPLVLRAAEDTMAGDPLDAAGEAAARDNGWSPPALAP
jgi:hypothetical protein